MPDEAAEDHFDVVAADSGTLAVARASAGSRAGKLLARRGGVSRLLHVGGTGWAEMAVRAARTIGAVNSVYPAEIEVPVAVAGGAGEDRLVAGRLSPQSGSTAARAGVERRE